MKQTSIAGLALVAALAVSAFRAPAEGIEPGTAAPELTARTWFNHIGRPLTLDNLGGNAVLVEFWATW